MIKELISLFYPQTCINCSTSLLTNENYLCLSCKNELPYTDDHVNTNNDLIKKFAFEPKVQLAASYLYFNKLGAVQKLLYQLKYKGKKELGKELGLWYGNLLKEIIKPDFILPIPIHKSKRKKRGYNQSEWIAKGLAETMTSSIMRNDLVFRVKKTDSQTSKSKTERWENVSNVYSNLEEDLTERSVLVIDDVITTGATVGMLCERLVAANVKCIYVASIARGQ